MTTQATSRKLSNQETSKEVQEALRSVIQVLIDGQQGFQEIGEHLKDEVLRRRFAAESLTRAQFRGDIEEALHQEGVHDINENGTVGGAVNRAWGDIMTHLGAGDHALLQSSEAGEDAANKAYQRALEKELPLPIKQLLTTQYVHIQTLLDYLRAARENTE